MFLRTIGEKITIKVILPDFLSYWHSKYVTKNKSQIVFNDFPFWIEIYWFNNKVIIKRESWFNNCMV